MGTNYILKYKNVEVADLGRTYNYDDPINHQFPKEDYDALGGSSILEDLYAVAAHHPTYAEFETMKNDILEMLADFAENCQRAGRISVLNKILEDENFKLEKS